MRLSLNVGISMEKFKCDQLGSAQYSRHSTLPPAEPVKKVQRTLLLEEVVNNILNRMLIKFVRFQIKIERRALISARKWKTEFAVHCETYFMVFMQIPGKFHPRTVEEIISLNGLCIGRKAVK